MSLLWGALFAGGVLLALRQLTRPRYLFVVRLKHDRATVESGQATGNFLRAVEEIAAAHGVEQGSISGKPVGGRIALTFSASFPRECQQQLRNWWGISGWLP
ncbi:MAG TPA: DUF3634 family protein [Pirellulaceae bacterium]|nr:DUF3634 family protein [Pirellulaceae bacterium]